MQTFGLGRGLAALIPTGIVKEENVKTEGEIQGFAEMLVSEILPNPNQPRKELDEKALLELAESIKAHGILQPLVVNENKELIAGQRRLAAAKILGLLTVPVVIKKVNPEANLEMSMIENIQRLDLSPIEEAEGYQSLILKFGLKQKEIAERVGKNRSTVANILRLLDLPFEIKKGLKESKISEGHAKVILGIDNSEKQIGLYQKIIAQGLSVRQTEAILEAIGKQKRLRVKKEASPILAEAEEKIREALGARVKVNQDGRVGKILIEFYSEEELEGIVEKMG